MLVPYALGLLLTYAQSIYTGLAHVAFAQSVALADCSAPRVTLSPKVTLRLARGLTAPHVALPYLIPVPDVTWPLPLQAFRLWHSVSKLMF